MNRRGITVIELFTVVIILTIILVVTVAGISTIICNTTKNAFRIEAGNVIAAVGYERLKNNQFDVTSVNESTVSKLLNISNKNYKSVTVTTKNDNVTVTIVGKNKWEGLTAVATGQNISVYNTKDR